MSYIILSFQYFAVQKTRIISSIRYFFFIAVMGIFIFLFIGQMGYNLQTFYRERLFSEGSINENTRYKAIFNFAHFFPQKPIFGTGVHLTEEIKEASESIGSSQIHVGYLSHLVSYGIFGSILLFTFWFLLARRLYRNAKLTNYWGAFFAFLIYFWAQTTLVNYSIFFTGLIFAFVFDKYYLDNYYEYRTKQVSYSQEPVLENI